MTSFRGIEDRDRRELASDHAGWLRQHVLTTVAGILLLILVGALALILSLG